VDGYICESTSGGHGTVSATLSKYFERPVHLVFKGPRPRSVDPTTAFPDLVATTKYQDVYPLMILSEENMAAIEQELRARVDTFKIDEHWKTDSSSIVIERWASCQVITTAADMSLSGSGQILCSGELVHLLRITGRKSALVLRLDQL